MTHPEPKTISSPSIPPALKGLKRRVLTDGNVTPIQGPNPRWYGGSPPSNPTNPDPDGNPQWVQNSDHHKFCMEMGFEEAIMIYNGTLNRLPTYASYKDGQLQYDGRGRPVLLGKEALSQQGIDWSKEDHTAADPPNPIWCSAAGVLAERPQIYDGYQTGNPHTGDQGHIKVSVRAHPAVIFDIENVSWLQVSPSDPLEKKLTMISQLTQAVKAVKQGAGANQEVWWYFTDALASSIFGSRRVGPPELLNAWDDFLAELAGVCFCHYWWDWCGDNAQPLPPGGRNAYETSQRGQILEEFFPRFRNGPKMVFLNTVYQIYWPQNDLPPTAELNDKPVPLREWCQTVDRYVELGYDLYLWTDTLVDAVKDHITYMSLYGHNSPNAEPN